MMMRSSLRPIVVKVARPLTSAGHVHVRDALLVVNVLVEPEKLPYRVRKALQGHEHVYFHVVRGSDGELVFGDPAYPKTAW